MAPESVTIRDVARRAGVSVGTASLALNNRPHISEAKRRKVLQAVTDLGYLPNVIGKALNRCRCGIIGVVVPVASPPHFPTIVAGINAAAESQGKPIFVSYSQDRADIEARMLKIFQHLYVDGVVLAAAPGRENVSLVRSLMDSGMVIVQVERYLPDIRGDFVGSDNRATAYDCTRRLLEKGHRRVGCIMTTYAYSVNDERYTGYLGALQEAGIEPRPEWMLRLSREDWGADALQRIRRFLTAPEAPRAVLSCVSFAEPLLPQVLNEQGWLNGRDVDVVLFDADPAADLGGQPFTIVVQDRRGMGREAARVLLQRAQEADAQHRTDHRIELRLPCQETHLTPAIAQR